MAIVRADTFTRANVASGFGTATDGHAWAIAAGDGQSVTSNEGEVSNSTASTFATLGPSIATSPNASVLVRFALTSATDLAGIFARFTDVNNWYLLRFDGAGNLTFLKKIAGTGTNVGGIAFAITTNTFYWLRFQVSGTTVQFRHWLDGNAEPATWDYSTTDSSLNGATNFVGVYAFAGGIAKFDHFSADDLVTPSGGGPTVYRFPRHAFGAIQ